MKRIVFLLVIIVMAVMNVKGQDGEWAELTPGYMWEGNLSGYSSYEDILDHRRLPTKSDFEYILNNCDWQKDKGDYLVYVRNDHSQYIRLKGVEIIACGHQNVNDNYSRYCGFWSSTDDGMNYKYLLRWRVSKGNTYMTNPYIGSIGMHYDDCTATKAGVIHIIPKSDWEASNGTYAEWYAKEKAERPIRQAKWEAKFEADKKEREAREAVEKAELEAKRKAWIESYDKPYVDFGLLSGTLWATCNVGAGASWKNGNLYAWGETEPKSDYSVSTYKHMHVWSEMKEMGRGKFSTIRRIDHTDITKYKSFGAQLELSDDAAYVNMGKEWRMPSRKDFEELYRNVNTREECALNYLGTGMDGVVIYNENNPVVHIFIPSGSYWCNEITDNGNRDISRAESFYSHAFKNGTFSFNVEYSANRGYGGHRAEGRYVRAVLRDPSYKSTVKTNVPSTSTTTPTNRTSSASNATNPSQTNITSNTNNPSQTNITSNTNNPPQTNTPSNSDAKYVDLGLPSGTLWADRNIGASNPEEYGDYFAWGETNPKSNYTWSSLKYCEDSDGNKFSKYNTQSKYGTILERSDDAAAANWGSGWCMPTQEQFQELKDKCTWTLTTKNGKKGYEVKGLNGNALFLPAAGCRLGTDLYYSDSNGYYWSSSFFTGSPYKGLGLDFDSGHVGSDWYGGRSRGQSVRPVRCK